MTAPEQPAMRIGRWGSLAILVGGFEFLLDYSVDSEIAHCKEKQKSTQHLYLHCTSGSTCLSGSLLKGGGIRYNNGPRSTVSTTSKRCVVILQLYSLLSKMFSSSMRLWRLHYLTSYCHYVQILDLSVEKAAATPASIMLATPL